MATLSADTLLNLYFAVIALLASWLAFRGWCLGFARQLITLLAVGLAYMAGYLGFQHMEPALRFLGYPALVTRGIAAALFGLLTFLAVDTLGRFFRRTADKKTLAGKLVSGVLGALLGLLMGGALFIVSGLTIRWLGALASPNVMVAQRAAEAVEAYQRTHPGEHVAPPPQPIPLLSNLARLHDALEHSGSGEIIRKVDPISPKAYASLIKLGLIVSNPDAVSRFLAYPGVSQIARHPRLLELQSDPEIAKQLASKSYFKLLRNERVVALANDPAFSSEIMKLDINKAMDHALNSVELPLPEL